MALGDLTLFPGSGGVVPRSEAARERADERALAAEAKRLQAALLGGIFATEVYNEASALSFGRPEDLMPTPDQVAFNGNYEIYDDMQRNVLRYGALQQGLIDYILHLPMVWLPGVKGDRESEMAAEAIASAWENIDERGTALRAMCLGFERGFSPLENVWGVHTRGAARDMISIVEMIDRPLSWFGFDYMNRPLFTRGRGSRFNLKPEPVPQHKVTFLRYGSLHTAYGKGTGQFGYPTVWAIQATMLGLMQMAERFGYMPAVVKYPKTPAYKRGTQGYASLKREMERQWKNILLLPADVENVDVSFPSTEAAYAAANASGQMRMSHIRLMEEWLSMYIQGVQFSSGNQSEGSFARDANADSRQIYKAAGHASCIEACLNRSFVRPTMLVNMPFLEESKWPRCAIDTTPGEDLELLLRVMESGAKMKVPIAHVTFSEKFNLPLAKAGEAVLDSPATQQPLIAAPQQPDEEKEPNPIALAEQMMGERSVITITGKDGQVYDYMSDWPVFTENRGVVKAGMLTSNDVIVEEPSRDRRRLRIAR